MNIAYQIRLKKHLKENSEAEYKSAAGVFPKTGCSSAKQKRRATTTTIGRFAYGSKLDEMIKTDDRNWYLLQ